MLLILGLEHIDDEELSSEWEEDYFGDAEVYILTKIECRTVSDSLQVVQALHANSIVLRLTAGSQEAELLASFSPIQKVPSVIVIKCVQPSKALWQVDISLLTAF